MEYKDYYAILGVTSTATLDEIKRAYRKLARKYHPDVSKEPEAEARFKDIAEAYAALKNPEKRATYDDAGKRYKQGREFRPPPGWNSGFEFGGGDSVENPDFAGSEFFEAIFGRRAGAERASHHGGASLGEDQHATVQISLKDAYQGGIHPISVRAAQPDSHGRMHMQERQLEVNIPKGVRAGQHLRLAGQGSPGAGGGRAGDLYLEITFKPHPDFRVNERDIYVTARVAPWEAALGASIVVPTPDGQVQMNVPQGSVQGRKLRMKGKGLPSTPPGDLYAVLSIALPPADGQESIDAYKAMAASFAQFNPRPSIET